MLGAFAERRRDSLNHVGDALDTILLNLSIQCLALLLVLGANGEQQENSLTPVET